MAKKSTSRIKYLLIIWLILLFTNGCGPIEPEEPTPTPSPARKGNLVIASRVGEVVEEVRCIGEKITYRIYYETDIGPRSEVIIRNPVDPHLTEVTVFNNGEYDSREREISWTIKLTRGGKGFVEFSAIVGDTEVIYDQAEIQGEGIRPFKTNRVQTTVCQPPDLGWIPFSKETRAEKEPSATMKDETTMGITVNFSIPGMLAYELTVNDVSYHKFSIPGYEKLINVGQPELPVVGQIIEVPHDVNFEPEIIKSESITLTGYNVYPAQVPVVEQEPTYTGFDLDQATYQTDADYPGYLSKVTAEDIGVVRGHRLVFLKVQPVQYNPVSRQVQAYSQIEVRLNFDTPAQINPVNTRLISPVFEALIEQSILNYKDLNRFYDLSSLRDYKFYLEPSGYDYLIITKDDFYNPSDPTNPIVEFQTWKQQKGLLTKVVKISSIGNTAAQIQSYLQNAYDTWSPAPSYVLLVGDADHINPSYQTLHDSHRINVGTPNEQATLIGTDLYYATLDGGAGDIFPDLMIGRISAETLNEVSAIIDKIMEYEKTPPANANFYDTTTLVRLFEDDTDPANPTPDPCPQDGREDCNWILIEEAEDLRDFLVAENYTVDRIYNFSGNHPQGPQQWEDGNALPANLTTAGGFQWTGDHHGIENAFNNGNFLISYRGHGSRNGWGEPDFNIWDLPNLTNGNLTPVVLGPTCQTGWFDNETDNGALGTNTESFAEEILREDNAGAVAVIASSRNSWGAYNNSLMRGFIDALWPDFDDSVTTGYLPHMGQLLTYGKVFLARNVSAHTITFEMTQLFGDPEMPVWIEEPQHMEVDHPVGIGGTGEQEFVVYVTENHNPINNATISLTRNNRIIDVKQTNPGGYARFNLYSVGNGDIEITVTSLKHHPYLGKITVSPNGGFLNRLDPQTGIENSSFYVGGQNFSGNEKIELSFGGQQVQSTQATSGSWGQSGVQDVGIKVPAGYSLGPVNVIAKGATSNRYAVDVFQVRTKNPIDLYLYSQWDDTTWNLTPEADPIWNNPDIQFYDMAGNPVASNNLHAGTNYTVKAKIHNDTDYPANKVLVTFKWADFGVGQPDRVWQEANTSPVSLNILANSIGEAEITWAPPGTGHLCMLVEIYHIEDIKESNNRGQENLHVGPTSSPAEVEFLIFNPTEKPEMVFLEVRQLGDFSQETRLWGVWIEQPEPQLIPPGGKVRAGIILDPKFADAGSGSQAEFSLTAYIDGKVIGGVNFIILIP